MYNEKRLAEELKEVMRELPVPLTIVTAEQGGEVRGITISSFTTLSLDPLLVNFNLQSDSQFCKFMREATHFAIHFPSYEHAGICKRFATSGLSPQEQFKGIKYFPNKYNTPVIESIPTVMYCRVYDEFKTGDHCILVGEVLKIYKTTKETGILYHNRSFKTLQAI